MKKVLIAAIVLLTLNTILFADITVSVGDFSVETDRQGYRYIGKGVSRLVAGELGKTNGISLVERDQILKIIDEQKMSLTGLTDESQQIEIGKMLSARYIVLGEIIDMMNSFLLSVRMIDVETGKIVWQEEKAESLENYDYIGAYFAGSIAKSLDLKVADSTSSKISTPKQKNEQAVIALSDGLAAYDEGDRETAKEKLSAAKTLDPESEVIAYYLAKLTTNSVKFMVITPPFYSYQNPAYLGILRTDRLHFNASNDLNGLLSFALGMDDYVPVNDSLDIREMDMNISLGYYFPVGEKTGFGFELFQSVLRNDTKYNNERGSSYYLGRFGQGGMISFGVAVSDTLALGISGAVFNLSNFHPLFAPPESDLDKLSKAAFSAQGGFLIHNADETFLFDSRGGITSASFKMVDPDTYTVTDDSRVPLLFENTLTLAFNEKRTFAVLKNLNELYIDNEAYYIRMLPAVEHFLSNSFSLRGGIEGAVLLNSDEDTTFGYGILAGITKRYLKSGIDLDINFTYREQPSRMVNDFLFAKSYLMINITFNDLFLSRD